MPGLLWNAPLSSTSIFGIVYEPAAVARVVIPGAKWQLGFTALYAGTSLPVENAPVCPGSFARMSQ